MKTVTGLQDKAGTLAAAPLWFRRQVKWTTDGAAEQAQAGSRSNP